MLITLNFHEDLRNLFPDKITLDAPTPLGALRLLAEQHPLKDKIEPVPVRFEGLSSIFDLDRPPLEEQEYTLVPTEAVTQSGYFGESGKAKAWLNIALGVVLVVASFFVPTTWGLAGSLLSSVTSGIGVSLTLTGIMQLLAPNPEDNNDSRRSAYFSTNKSTTSPDTPIPLAFGRRKLYAHYISLNMDARNFNGDLEEDSIWFEGKVDEHKPYYRLKNFYGLIRASDENKVLQIINDIDRTGEQT